MLTGLRAPLRIVLQRSFADWLIVVATWLVIVCATTLVAIGVLYGDAVALTGLQRIVADQPVTATSVVVQMRASVDELAEVQPTIEAQAGRVLRWTGGELIAIERSESWALPDQASDGSTSLAVFGSYAAIEDHADLLDGSWPDPGADPMEVAVSSATADALAVRVGDELELTSQRGADRSAAIMVVGIWEPIDPTDPYWQNDPLELTGVTAASSFLTHGPLVVDRQDLLQRTVSGNVSLEYRVLPEFDRLAVDDVNSLRADSAALERRLGDALGDRAFFQVSTELHEILASANRSLLVSRSGVVVLTIQFAVLAGYALLLVAGLLVDQRRVETALFRSRGAGVGHVVLFSFLEALILVAPAVIAAPWLAVGALGLLNVAGPLADVGIRIEPRVDQAAILAAAGAGLAAVIGLVVPALGAGRGLAAVRQTISRQGNRTLAQRLGFDLVLVLLAGIGLWQLRTYGAPLTETVRGSVGLDPLLVAAPAIGLLAGSILALRIVPLAAELAERVLTGRRGLVAPMGARQLSRRPLRYTRSALLLMLAAALGTFAGAYASTWTRSQADQAAYRTGADLRVVVSDFPDLPGWAIGQAYRSVDGVADAVPVSIDRFDLERSGNGRILAIDTRRASPLVTLRPDLADLPLDEVLATLADRGRAEAGVPLAGEPVGFGIEVTAELEPLIADDEGVTFPPGLRGIAAFVVLRDADGVVHHVAAPRLAVGLGRQPIELRLAAAVEDGAGVPPAYPLELLGVSLRVELPEGALATGTISLDALTVVSAAGSATAVDTSDVEPIAATASEPIAGFGAASSTVLDMRVGTEPAALAPVPALASERYLELTGVQVGDVVELGQLTQRRQYEIVGSLRGFPTLDPAEPFLLVDIGALAIADEAAGAVVDVDEWWLAVDDGSEAAVADALRAEGYSAESVLAREELHRDLLSDPVALGLIGALVLGALAAVIFASIGFIVSATVSARERLSEFALLQAIGLSHRQLSAWISMENAFLLLIGLLAGTGLGLLLAWVVLPFVTLTQEATLAVPPVEVVVPWGIYGLLYLVALLALGMTVLVIGNLLGRVRVSGVLRSGGE